jgi:methionyl aminopeptidase
MIQIKSPREIEIMARGGEILAATVRLLERSVSPGITTADLDKIADEFIRSYPGATPAFKGLYNFPASICTSINQ